MNKKEFLNLLKEDICHDGREAFLNFEGSIEEYFDTHPRGAKAFFWCIREGMEHFAPQFVTSERTDRCAEKDPNMALNTALHLLTRKRFEACARECPFVAKFEVVKRRLLGTLPSYLNVGWFNP